MSEDISNTLNLLFKNFEDEKNDDIVDKRKNNIYRLEGKHDDACIGFVKYLHGNLTTAMKSNLLQSFKTELHRKCGDYNGLFESPVNNHRRHEFNNGSSFVHHGKIV